MKKVLVGTVKSDKNNKTRTVVVRTQSRHPVLEKFVRKSKSFFVHDEQNASHEGDVVEIQECRPRSKNKRWLLLNIVKKSEKLDKIAAEEEQVTLLTEQKLKGEVVVTAEKPATNKE
ncbi:MAG: 30S ribosomal protein S17 [Elusimicrobiota bacterium]